MGQFTDWAAFWGLLGALIHAGPKFITCFYDDDHVRHPRSRCFADFVTREAIGAIAAAAFSPSILGYLHLTTPQDAKAMSAAIGMLANPLAPELIKRGVGIGEWLLSILNSRGGKTP